MLDLVRPRLVTTPTSSSGDRKPFVLQTVQSDDECAFGADLLPSHSIMSEALLAPCRQPGFRKGPPMQHSA